MKIVDSEVKATVRVFSYARWSSEAQSEGDSNRRQQAMAEAWCRQRGLSLSGMEKDEGVSAKSGRNRLEGSGLSRLLKATRPGDVLLVEDMDRLTREDWLTGMNFLNSILAKGVRVVTLATGNEIDSDRFHNDIGCFLPAVLRAFLGNDENRKKAGRIKASWQARIAAAERGEQGLNANLPGWLNWDADAKKVVVDEAKAEVVRRMFKIYLAEGKLFNVSRTLTEEGAIRPSRKANATGISKDYVFRCLTNRAVMGECRGKPGLWPAIVKEADFCRVAERLKLGRHQTQTRKATGENIFGGLATCSKCGGPLHRHGQKRHGRTYDYLVCGETLRGRKQCGLSGIRYDVLRDSFLGLLAQEAEVITALTTGDTGPSAVDVLEAKLADAQAQCEKYMRLMEGDASPSKRMVDALKALESKEAELTAQLEAERNKAQGHKTPLENYRAIRKELPTITLKINPATLRTLLAGLVERVAVDIKGDQFAVYFKGGKAPFGVKLFAKGVSA